MHTDTDISLETILLANDRRNVSALQPFLPADFCQQAAHLALENAQRVLITTGFYLTRFELPETDGPPGALAIGRALHHLGAQITYVTDQYAAGLMSQFGQDHAGVVCFPITGPQASREFADHVLEEYQPTLLVSVERCGLTREDRYLNVRGLDISDHTARVDYLFDSPVPSIGIGDGGNEIGMGCLSKIIPTIPGLPKEPTVTCTSSLIISSVSNWGSYGLVAALSALTHQNLLHSEEEETTLLQEMFASGCYDGTMPIPTLGVDGFSIEENNEMLAMVRTWLTHKL